MSRIASPRLVAREAETARLREGFGRAASGRPGFVLVAGEAGVGKTRLVQEHAAWVMASGGWALSGACLQVGDQSLPYGPFIDALAGVSGEEAAALRLAADRTAVAWPLMSAAARTDPAGSSGADLAAQAGLFASALRVLQGLTDDRPLLLVIDDLHWADPASRDLLAYLVRRLRSERIQTVATYRDDATHRRHPLVAFLAEAERWPSTERIDLGRLGREATAELVEAVLGRPPERALVDRVWRRSDGNPFFAEELLASNGRASGSVGTTLQQVLDARLAALSDPAQRVLGAAAVLGRRPEHALLEALVDMPADGLLAAIRECVEARLLVPLERPPHAPIDGLRDPSAGADYEFRHALVQEAAYDELLPAERADLHRRAANLLVARIDLEGEVPVAVAGEIALHAERARDLPLALRAAIAAGRGAMAALAFEEADRDYSLALELWGSVPADARPAVDPGELLGMAAHAAAYARDPGRAARHQRRRIDLLSEDDAARLPALLHELFWYHWEASEVGAFPLVAEAALELVPASPASAARAIALADLGFARWSVCDHLAAARLAGEALAIAEELGEPAIEASSRYVLAMAHAGLGRMEEADRLFAAADAGFRAAGDTDGLARNAHWWANALEIGGAFDRALEVAAAGLEEARRSGIDPRHGDDLRAVVAENLSELGRWTEAVDTSAAGFDWGAAIPSEIWLHGVHARIRIRQGELEEARRHIDAAGGVPAIGPDRIWQLEERLNLAYVSGDLDDARATLGEAIAAAADPSREAALWWSLCTALDGETEAAIRARASGDAAAAADARARAEETAGLLELGCQQAIEAGGAGPIAPALLAWSRAQQTRLAGRSDPVAWAEAVARRDALPEPYDAAVGRLRLAEALLGAGVAPADVAPVLRAAHATARELGAVPLCASIDAVARSARIDLSAAPPAAIRDPGGPSDPHGLTVRELEVLALVAAGRTNREIGEALFISPKTASVHVTHIMDKLGVSSRVEAALLGAHLGLVAAVEPA